jgi:DsbC/DsbD-like thiol-disulfide interchange protein
MHSINFKGEEAMAQSKFYPAYISFFIVIFLFSGLTGISKDKEVLQVKTYLSRDQSHPGETFKVGLLVKVIPGWHIHAAQLEDEFLIPTSLDFEGKEGLEVQGYYFPPAIKKKYEYSESELSVYEGECVFGVLIQADNKIAPGKYNIKGRLKYQACDSTSCLPPKEVKLKIPLAIVPLTQETKEINPEVFSQMEFKNPAETPVKK